MTEPATVQLDWPAPGEEALRIGLADALVADADLMASAIEHACTLAALPLAAFARTKARLSVRNGGA